MYWHPSIPEDERWQPGVFFHVTDSRWVPGSALLGWERQKELGLRDDAEWSERYRDKVPLGHDWGVVSLFRTLRDAREYCLVFFYFPFLLPFVLIGIYGADAFCTPFLDLGQNDGS